MSPTFAVPYCQCHRSVSATELLITFNTIVKVELALFVPCQHSDILKEGSKLGKLILFTTACVAINTSFFKVAEATGMLLVLWHGHALNSFDTISMYIAVVNISIYIYKLNFANGGLCCLPTFNYCAGSKALNNQVLSVFPATNTGCDIPSSAVVPKDFACSNKHVY